MVQFVQASAPQAVRARRPGLAALDDADYLEFLKAAEVEELTPDFRSDVSGVQLSALDTVGRQRLARFVADRGVVVSSVCLPTLEPRLNCW